MKSIKILAAFAAAVMVLAGCGSPAGMWDGDDGGPVRETGGRALKSAGSGTDAVKIIKVKFDVRNGGTGLWKSGGIVSTQDDSRLIYNEGSFSRDYTITITVPAKDEYLNIRWWGDDFWLEGTYVKTKTKAETGTIILDYNGCGEVATSGNLYDVRVSDTWDKRSNLTELAADWEKASKRAVRGAA